MNKQLLTGFTNNYWKLISLQLYLVLMALVLSASLVKAEILVPVTIAKGGNLIHIARDFCNSRNDWKELAKLNNLTSPYLIYPGATIKIPLRLLLTKRLSAQVGSVSGGVFVVEKGGKLRELRKGDLVFPGQTVVTGEEGFAYLIFPDNRFTRIASESRFTMTYLVRLTDKSMKAEFYLEKGRIVHAVRKKLRQNESYITRTPVSVTGVRGTEFRLKMEGGDRNFIETLSGTVGVEASGILIALKKGQGIEVVEGKDIEKPRKLPPSPAVPELADVYRTLPLIFPTAADTSVNSLRLRVTTDSEGTDTILELISAPGGNFTLLALEDRTYYGFLTSIDDQTFESIPATPFPITVRTIPSAPILANTLNGKTTFDKQVTQKWLKGAQVKTFHLQLAKDNEFTEIVDEKDISKPEYTTPELEPGDYYFRLKAVAGDGFNSLYSLTDTWTISAQPELGELETSSGDGVSLTWASMGEGITYDLQVSQDKKFSKMVASAPDLTEPTYNITSYLQSGNYYVRIRGVLGDGQVSPWTPYQVLKIEPATFGWLDAGIIVTFLAIILI